MAPELQISASKPLSVALWMAQVLLALLFGMAGFYKLTRPIAELSMKLSWASDVPEALVRFIGTSELLGAVGVILPSLTRTKPGLAPLAALGLVTIMVLAMGFHVSRGEFREVGFNALLATIGLFVAWGRGRRLPIAPR